MTELAVPATQPRRSVAHLLANRWALLVLPAALYGEALLLAWPVLLPICLVYTLLIGDLALLAAFIAIMTLIVWVAEGLLS